MSESPFGSIPKLSSRQKRRLVAYVAIILIYAAAARFPAADAPLPPQEAGVPTAIETILPAGTEAAQLAAGEFLVTRIVDGDTIQISENGLPDGPKKTVRYIGIDTPETVRPGTAIECFGKEASARNAELALNKIVRLERDTSDTDRYGRLLRYAYADGIMINEALVRGGYAKASAYPPDIARKEILATAERAARADKAGLWGAACASKGAE